MVELEIYSYAFGMVDLKKICDGSENLKWYSHFLQPPIIFPQYRKSALEKSWERRKPIANLQ